MYNWRCCLTKTSGLNKTMDIRKYLSTIPFLTSSLVLWKPKLHTSSLSGQSWARFTRHLVLPPPPGPLPSSSPRGETFAFHRFCGSILCFTNAWPNFLGSLWNDLIYRLNAILWYLLEKGFFSGLLSYDNITKESLVLFVYFISIYWIFP